MVLGLFLVVLLIQPGSKTQIMAALDKAKANLPSKPAPPPPTKAIRGGGGGGSGTQKSMSPPGINGSKEESFDNGSEGSPSTNPRGVQRTAKGGTNRASSKTRVKKNYIWQYFLTEGVFLDE